MPDGQAAPTVLLVEDEADCRWLWRFMIDGDHRFGQVFEAASLSEPLEVMTRQFPDIVLTDVRMPRACVLEVLEFLRSRHPMPMTVATSACPDVAEETIRQGAAAFWTKLESLSPEMSEHLWHLWQQRQADEHRHASAGS